jgi:hypothetical protein
MSDFVSYQDFLTVEGTSVTIAQSSSEYLDTQGIDAVVVRVEIASCLQGTLYVETAACDAGPWSVLETWTATDTDIGGPAEDMVLQWTAINRYYAAATSTDLFCVTKDPEAPTSSLMQRYIRWRAASDGTAGNFVCFRILVSAKRQ